MSLNPKMLAGFVLIALLVIPIAAVALAPALAPAETKGTVLAVFPDQQSLIVSDDNGGNITFYLDYQGKVLMDERPAKLEDLQPGDHVRVIHCRSLRSKLRGAAEKWPMELFIKNTGLCKVETTRNAGQPVFGQRRAAVICGVQGNLSGRESGAPEHSARCLVERRQVSQAPRVVS
jgi:hypothetical protein